MNLFDLHCDTIGECYAKKCALARNSLALDLKRTAAYRSWAQFFAVWIDDSLRGQEAFLYFQNAACFLMQQLAENAGTAVLCRTGAQLKKAAFSGKRAALLSVEGSAAFAGDLAKLNQAAEMGVRLVTLTWNGSCEAADGCGVLPEPEGLRPFGFLLLREMENLGITADVSHLSDAGFRDVARAARKPFIASHSNSRAVCGHRRNLTDEQFCEIARGGGLVGLNFCSEFLRESNASALDVLRHADHFLHLGGEKALAIGSDLDGCTTASGLDSEEKLKELYRLFFLKFGEETTNRIFWGNAFSFFCRNLP